MILKFPTETFVVVNGAAVKLYTDFSGGRECLWTYHRLMEKTSPHDKVMNRTYVKEIKENQEYLMPKPNYISANFPKYLRVAQNKYRRACRNYLNALDKEFSKDNPDDELLEKLRLEEVKAWNVYNDAFNTWLKQN